MNNVKQWVGRISYVWTTWPSTQTPGDAKWGIGHQSLICWRCWEV